MPGTAKDTLEVVKQGGASNADTLGTWTHFPRPIHTSKFIFSCAAFAGSSSSVGVLAGGLWRRLAAIWRFAHRDGARTRSRRRLRYFTFPLTPEPL